MNECILTAASKRFQVHPYMLRVILTLAGVAFGDYAPVLLGRGSMHPIMALSLFCLQNLFQLCLYDPAESKIQIYLLQPKTRAEEISFHWNLLILVNNGPRSLLKNFLCLIMQTLFL